MNKLLGNDLKELYSKFKLNGNVDSMNSSIKDLNKEFNHSLNNTHSITHDIQTKSLNTHNRQSSLKVKNLSINNTLNKNKSSPNKFSSHSERFYNNKGDNLIMQQNKIRNSSEKTLMYDP